MNWERVWVGISLGRLGISIFCSIYHEQIATHQSLSYTVRHTRANDTIVFHGTTNELR